jgi:TonB family protein
MNERINTGMEEKMKKVFLVLMAWCVLTAGISLSPAEAAPAESPDGPKIIKKVNPVYPEEAVQKRIEGLVMIEATADENGDVVDAKVMPAKNPQPLLEEAALAAVRQWKYEPFLINGKATAVTFTVTMNFALQKDKEAALASDASKDHPKLLKKVSPVYPKEAAREGIEGLVKIEATADENGDVVDAKVLPSENPRPLLEEAALAAVRQWKYEPFLKDGKAVPVTFTVTMNFALNKEKKKEE